MAKFLQLALWNANGLTQHTEELKTFISIHNIDVMLISEMHFTEKSYLKLPNYAVYHQNCYNKKKYHHASSTEL
jgi:hypothetical protein